MKKIWLDNERFVACEVTTDGEIDTYSFGEYTDELQWEKIVKAMESNGFCFYGLVYGKVMVKRKFFKFKGVIFHLNQCSDLFDWFEKSEKGDFTYYYDRIVFHHTDGKFYAAYLEDTSNFIEI